MKLTSFNCTIEVSKDENGYSNNYYIDVTDKGVSISHPYVTQTPEQVMFITEFIRDFISRAIDFNRRVDGFNYDMGLEQYAPQVAKSEETASEASPESLPSQPSHGGSVAVDSCPEVSTTEKNPSNVHPIIEIHNFAKQAAEERIAKEKELEASLLESN